MDLEKIRQLMAQKLSQARTLQEKNTTEEGTIAPEIATQINGLLGEYDELKAQLDIAQRIQGAESHMNDPATPPAAALHGGFRNAGPGEGDAPIDPKAWRSVDIQVPTPFGLIEKSIRYHVPLAIQVKGYEPAFEAFLRKSRDFLGPNDRKALAEATDAAGGYWVPEDYHAEVIRKMATMATMRLYARVMTTSRDVAKWPRVVYNTDNKWTSGVRITWTGETPSSSTAHRVTDQVAGLFAIPINTAMASQLISMDMIEDAAFDVLGLSSELFAEAWSLGENLVFWTGSGAAQPRGLLTSLADSDDVASLGFTTQVAATANTIAANEVIDVVYGLPTQYERNARMFLTKATEKAIRKLTDSDGQYLWPIIPQVGQLGPVGGLLGFPVTRDEFMHDISDSDNTSTFPLVFGDPKGYLIADRVGLSIQRNDSLYSETNQVLLLGRKRVGGQTVEGYKFSALNTVAST